MLANIEEIAHIIKQLVTQQAGEFKPFLFGHVASYDPTKHRVRVIFPSLRDEATNQPVLSSWMQLGTLMVGNGWGIQHAPMGGATMDDPTAGEQVKVNLVERDGSVVTCAHLNYTDKMVPPFTEMKPGEVGLMSPGGSKLFFHHDGQGNEDVEVDSARTFTVTAKQDVTVTATEGNVTVTASKGDVTVEASNKGQTVTIKADNVVLADSGGPHVARVGDTTTCPAGTGRITSGSSKVTAA